LRFPYFAVWGSDILIIKNCLFFVSSILILIHFLAIAANQKTEEELAKELEILKQENEKLCGAAWSGIYIYIYI
jgi:hypothetical protein